MNILELLIKKIHVLKLHIYYQEITNTILFISITLVLARTWKKTWHWDLVSVIYSLGILTKYNNLLNSSLGHIASPKETASTRHCNESIGSFGPALRQLIGISARISWSVWLGQRALEATQMSLMWTHLIVIFVSFWLYLKLVTGKLRCTFDRYLYFTLFYLKLK